MAEERPKKVDNGRVLFDNYQRKKHEAHGRTGDIFSTAVASAGEEASYNSMSPEKHLHDIHKPKLDAANLLRKTAHFDSLNMTIKKLQETLSEKNELIDSLEIQNKVLREGTGDHSNSAPAENEKRMIRELQTMVDARDTYITQLSESLQQRSQELGSSLVKEKELTKEIQNLQQEISLKAKQTDSKLAESYNEGVEYRAKVEMLTTQIQEYSKIVNSMKVSLENNSKELDAKQKELREKNKKIEKYKTEASDDIKKLMRQVEGLNHDVSKKEVELLHSRKELENLHSQQDEQFGTRLEALKKELERKYAEDVKKVELLYDEMWLEHIRKSDLELNAIEKCSDLEAQISSCRLSHEEEINTYKEDLKKLLEKSKSTEENLLSQLDKYKQDSDYYRQQVENFENKLAEEIQKIKDECNMELNKCEVEMKAFKESCDQEKDLHYTEEINRLSNQLKDYAIVEGQKEVKIETYKNELKKCKDCINSVVGELNNYKDAYEKQCNQILQLETKLSQCNELNITLQTNINESQRREHEILLELEGSKTKLIEYEQEIYDLGEKLKFETDQFNEKYLVVVQMFEEKTQKLVSELNNNKLLYDEDILRLTHQTNEQQREIQNLEERLTSVLRADKESINTLCNQTELLKQNLMLAESTKESSARFLLDLLRGLRDIKNYIKSLVHSTTTAADSSPQEESEEALNDEALRQELENTLHDLLSLTQTLHHSVSEFNIRCTSPNIITSTPNVKQYNGDNDNADLSSNTYIDNWMKKCAWLEGEKEKLTQELEVLTANLKEMEYCLLVASQESTKFNRKCQILDAKISEMEKSKLTEHLLKKENNELKQQLEYMKETEQRFQKEMEVLNKNNEKLELMFNKNILELHNKLSKGELNEEMETILADLKEKSEEVISLKKQQALFQKTEDEYRRKLLDMQSKYEGFVAEHDSIVTQLNTKKKDLDEVWEERNNLSTENKILQSKLLSIQDRNSYHPLKEPSTAANSANSGIVVETGNHWTDRTAKSEGNIVSLDCNLDQFGLSRLKTLQLLSSTRSLAHGLNKAMPSNRSVADQINYQLQLLDQQGGESPEYHMPTILEEDLEEEMLPGKQYQVPKHF